MKLFLLLFLIIIIIIIIIRSALQLCALLCNQVKVPSQESEIILDFSLDLCNGIICDQVKVRSQEDEIILDFFYGYLQWNNL